MAFSKEMRRYAGAKFGQGTGVSGVLTEIIKMVSDGRLPDRDSPDQRTLQNWKQPARGQGPHDID